MVDEKCDQCKRIIDIANENYYADVCGRRLFCNPEFAWKYFSGNYEYTTRDAVNDLIFLVDKKNINKFNDIVFKADKK